MIFIAGKGKIVETKATKKAHFIAGKGKIVETKAINKARFIAGKGQNDCGSKKKKQQQPKE
jgi:hypothetical protein